jgi:hypothetical protein
VNTYAYVGNNPVGLVDPSGLLFEWMGGPWTGFGSDISTPGNFGAAAAGAATGYGLGSGLTALAKLGKAVDAVLPNCPQVANSAKNNFAIADRVFDQLKDPRMGQLAGKLDASALQELANSPGATRVLDARSGHINVIQEVEGKLLRITVPRDEMKIISVGPIRPNQVQNLLNKGDFVPLP